MNHWDYSRFKKEFYKKAGLDLDCYKDRQMERRIRQFMQREGKEEFKLFFDHLTSNSAVLERFLNYLTINTSEFFRDNKIFNRLKEEIIPELMYKNSNLKIWSAGCSIGAEPYTIAIILKELNVLKSSEIIGTDVDHKALSIAEKGCYNTKQLGKIPDNFIRNYFEEHGEEYCVNTPIKKAVSFKNHNLLSDRPYTGCNLILCRNVFIYFKQETQFFLLERFSQSLVPGGFLVIGSAEYISNPGAYDLSKRYNTIYQKS